MKNSLQKFLGGHKVLFFKDTFKNASPIPASNQMKIWLSIYNGTYVECISVYYNHVESSLYCFVVLIYTKKKTLSEL
jgi:hypothetical protein